METFESLIWGAVLRGSQCLLQAAPYIVTGLVTAGIFRRLLGHEGMRRLFGHGTRSASWWRPPTRSHGANDPAFPGF